MKRYTHDYTLPSEAESVLYSATRLMANECYDAALERINEARHILQRYIAQDNMIEDEEVEDGFVRYQDISKAMKNFRETQETQNLLCMETVRRSEEVIARSKLLREENKRLRDRVEELERKNSKL